MPKSRRSNASELNDQRRSRRIAGLPPDATEQGTPQSQSSLSCQSSTTPSVPRKRPMGAQVSLSFSQADQNGRPSKRSRRQESNHDSNDCVGKSQTSTTMLSDMNKSTKKSNPSISQTTSSSSKVNSACQVDGTNFKFRSGKKSLSPVSVKASGHKQNSRTMRSQAKPKGRPNSKSLSRQSKPTQTTSTPTGSGESGVSGEALDITPIAGSSQGDYNFEPSSAKTKGGSTDGMLHSTPCSRRQTLKSRSAHTTPFSPETRNVGDPLHSYMQSDLGTFESQGSKGETGLEEKATQLAGSARSTQSSEPRQSQRQSSFSRQGRNRSSIGLPLSIVSPSSSYSSSFAVPVKDQAFCDCWGRKVDSRKDYQCLCGEEDTEFDWAWDPSNCSAACDISCDGRLAKFHLNYSCGTAACRGTKPMVDQQYFWEIKMTTSVYGTDMMIGIGSGEVNLNAHAQNFCSLLGRDSETWGLSYTGNFYHAGQSKQYGSKFGQGSIIGVHLDMWKGVLTFYKNRKPLGVACKGLYGKTLYPMISSTAARSAMKLTKAITCDTTLQFFCCQVLRSSIPKHLGVVDVLELPPGLRIFLENNFGWLLSSVDTPAMPPMR